MGGYPSHVAINVSIYGTPPESAILVSTKEGRKLRVRSCTKKIPEKNYGDHTIAAYYDNESDKLLICIIGETNVYASIFKQAKYKEVFHHLNDSTGFYIAQMASIVHLQKIDYYGYPVESFNFILDEVTGQDIYSYYVKHAPDRFIGALFRQLVTREGLTDVL